jgi:CBS domain-containing protein
MLVSKVMSWPIIGATAETTIREAAQRMRDHDVGSLPVVHDGRPIGIVTDRDIVLRVMAAPDGTPGPDATVTRIMSRDVLTCFDDDDVRKAAALMGERQVRRLLVIDRAGAPVGLLSVCDIAEHASEELAGQALGEISEGRAHGTHRL